MKPEKSVPIDCNNSSPHAWWQRALHTSISGPRTIFQSNGWLASPANRIKDLAVQSWNRYNIKSAWDSPGETLRSGAIWCGLACLITAAFLPGAFQTAYLLGLIGALLLFSVHGAVITQLRKSPETTGDHSRLEMLSEMLDHRLEQLQDKTWEISESTTRYRELLDAQNGLIVRCNATGELTFVNKAFCVAFGLDKNELLGKSFTPILLDEHGKKHKGRLPERSDGIKTQYMETRDGPRWIKWETHELSKGDEGVEIQLIGHDVTQAKVIAAKLKNAANQAQEGNRAKSRFLAAMSHEIRTPMNGILGMTSLLHETSLDPEQRSYCQAIEQSSRTLIGLIDEILDFSKIEAGKIALRNDAFSLATCIQSVVELLAPRAHEKGLQLAWYVDPACPAVINADKARVHQILLNLLSNAIKFTDKGGITVSATRDPGISAAAASSTNIRFVRIDVRDTGIGMSQADRKALFKEFEQTENAIRRHSGGTGLGLVISKRLACAMGGDITLKGTHAEGSIFSLLLPAGDDVSSANDKEPGFKEARSSITSEQVLKASHKVLLVSNRELEREVMSRVLRHHNMETVQVSPQNAIAEIKNACQSTVPFNRIMIDGNCDPHLAQQIFNRASADHPGILGIVAVDALERSLLPKYKQAGYKTHLIRPIRPSALIREILASSADKRRRPIGPTDDRAPQGINSETAAQQSTAMTERLVLLAEDNAINELLATRIIEKAGHRSISVRTGLEAVGYMRAALNGEKALPDLILMDILMPDMDGVTATEQIKSLYIRHHGAIRRCPPVIAVTANAFEEDRQRYLHRGLDDYLSKPFEARELTRVIEKWCSAGKLLEKMDSADAIRDGSIINPT